MKYYELPKLNNSQQKYGNFLNDYEPYQEIREFRNYSKKFKGFSNNSIVFKRDKSYENNEPISDFLVNDWGEIIVSKKIYEMLKEKYSNEIEFFDCFVENYEGEPFIEYYILRPKKEIDALDKDKTLFGPMHKAVKMVLDNEKMVGVNYCAIKDGACPVVSEEFYKDIKKLKPTCFEAWQVKTIEENQLTK